MPIPNPHDADMERRLLLAMVLSMAILFLAPYFYRQLYPPPPAPIEPPPQRQAADPTPAPPAPMEPPPSLAEGEAATKVEVRDFSIENNDLSLTWSNQGGVLLSARLKHYGDPPEAALELLPQDLPPALRSNLALRVGEEYLDRRLLLAAYELRGPSAQRTRMQAPLELELYYRDAELEVLRRIRVPEAGHLLELTSEVRVRGQSVPHWLSLGPGIGEVTATPGGDFESPGLAYYGGGAVERRAASELEEPQPLPGVIRWLAQDSKFFAYVLLSPEGFPGGNLTRIQAGPDGVQLAMAEVEASPGQAYQVFIGPKDYEILGASDETLVQLIDYGWFAFLVKPLLFSLKFFYGYIQNYGWSIIALTFIINLALFPVRYKQMASMKKMSELQPQLKTIQDKYKKMKRADPRRQKMNEEVMALYKTHGVNPLGGCLPLVIQMPFLFAFYQMLYSSIELRGAPFIGWIHDLSRYDPYYVTPILMGASMVIQQKMTPATGDPTQRKMMMILPIVFTFFFLNFSSGLVLYFLFSNLFGMMFQAAFQRLSPDWVTAQQKTKSTD